MSYICAMILKGVSNSKELSLRVLAFKINRGGTVSFVMAKKVELLPNFYGFGRSSYVFRE
jgi:hypothetical protein